MQKFVFTSSAIQSPIVMENDKVTVTFTGNREYTYKASNPNAFSTALQGEINDPEGSVGRFINRSIRAQDLVTVW